MDLSQLQSTLLPAPGSLPVALERHVGAGLPLTPPLAALLPPSTPHHAKILTQSQEGSSNNFKEMVLALLRSHPRLESPGWRSAV